MSTTGPEVCPKRECGLLQDRSELDLACQWRYLYLVSPQVDIQESLSPSRRRETCSSKLRAESGIGETRLTAFRESIIAPETLQNLAALGKQP